VYGQNCVALHGWEHQSHARWEQWQESIIKSQDFISVILDKNQLAPLFRPPYGQRKADSGDFFKARNLRVALWNIDSQDWQASMDAAKVENRILALMLIKRHGVLLFHDTHAKALQALPGVFTKLGAAVSWPDCHSLL
jgi:peptidoglycan/xylan/chitin deacetylase (PgdA/CDA1 family)